MGFVHLHTHSSDGSLLDGLANVKELALKAKELNQEALAITEHGFMGSMVKFYKACRKEQIKPILGYEAYLVEDVDKTRENKQRDMNHLVLLAKNKTGLENILLLSDLAFKKGFYYKPRIDKNMLTKHKDGLVVLSACLAGDIPQAILNNNLSYNLLYWYLDNFGDDFYLELQDHGIQEQKAVNRELIKIAKECGIKLVATNDIHYLNREDAEPHRVLLCTQTQKTWEEFVNNKGFEGFLESEEFYLKSEEEMRELFPDIQEAIDNTVEVANKCNVVLERLEPDVKPKYLFPSYPIPKGFDTHTYFKHLCEDGFKKRYEEERWSNIDDYKKRLDYEIEVISNMGFEEYFLILWDIVNFCKQKDIPVGPGRGCFVSGSKILLEDGTIKNIEDVEVGDVVITAGGEPNMVYATPRYEVSEELIKIKAGKGSEEVISTSDHKYLVLKTAKCMNRSYDYRRCKETCKMFKKCRYRERPKLQWVKANDIEIGDYLCYPKFNLNETDFVIDLKDLDKNITYNLNKVWHDIHRRKVKINRFIKLDENFAKFAGYFLANGKVKHNSIIIKYNQAESYGLVTDIQESIRKVFGIRPDVAKYKNTRIYRLKIVSMIAANFCRKFLTDALPLEFINSNKYFLYNFLSALLNISPKKITREQDLVVTLRNEKLAYQVQFLLSQFGVYATVKNKTIFVSAKQLFKIIKMFNKVSVKFKKYYRNDVILEDESYYYIKVLGKESVEYKGTVYDLSVENNPSFIVNGFAVHNSAAGSLVSYCLGITNIDPLKYELLFERFLDPSRVSMPDIDVDFCYDRVGEVYDYVVQKYGEDYVRKIGTYGTLGAKAVLKDVARVFGYSYEKINYITKLLPDKPKLKIEEALEESAEFAELVEEDELLGKIVEISKKLQGGNRHTSEHAAGVIISPVPLNKFIPVKEDATQLDMNDLEEYGFVKMDLLKLRTLTVIKDTLNRLKAKGINLNVDKIPLDDQKVLELFREGNTVGVFQFESHGIRQMLKSMKPTCFEDLIASAALYRPGPLDYIDEVTGMTMVQQFIARKNGEQEVTYDHPLLEPILNNTYGIFVYQEQIMKTAVALAGYTLSESDELRKVIGKKKLELIPQQREKFVNGCVENGIEEELASHIFDKIETFGKYGYD